MPTAWGALIGKLKNGVFDITIAGMSITPERALSVNFSRPYYTTGINMVLNRQCTKGMTFSDHNQKSVSIGVVIDSIVDKFVVREKFPRATKERYQTVEKALDAVLKGEIHA